MVLSAQALRSEKDVYKRQECERYIRYNKVLLFEDAGAQIRKRIEEL